MPCLEQYPEASDYRRLTTLGVVAWNRAVEPELFPEERVYSMLEDSGISDPEPVYEFIEELKARKLQKSPHDDRIILDAEVNLRSDGTFYLVAAAAAKGKPDTDSPASPLASRAADGP